MASYMKEKEDFWCSFFDYFWFCIYFSFLLAHLKTWEISNANSPNKKKLCFGALTRPIKGKHVKFTRHSAVDGTCAAPMKAKRKQIGGWKGNYEIKRQIYGTTFSCQQAMNCTHYCHCVALSIPKRCDLLEAWFAISTAWTHFSQHHKSTDSISGTNALSSCDADALYLLQNSCSGFFVTTTILTWTMLQKQATAYPTFCSPGCWRRRLGDW